MENTSCQSIICGIMGLIIMPRRVLRRKTEEGSTSAGWECRTAKNTAIRPFRQDGSIALHFQEKSLKKTAQICQRPIRELEEKKHLVSDVKGMLVGEEYPVYEMTISDITKNRFKVILSEKLILDYADGKFRMHFTDQDKTSVSSGRSMRYVEVEEVENLKILADTSSVEVFVNDGEYVFSTRYYPEVYKLQAEAVGAQITLSEIM